MGFTERGYYVHKDKYVFKRFVFAHLPFYFASLQVLGRCSSLVAHEDYTSGSDVSINKSRDLLPVCIISI